MTETYHPDNDFYSRSPTRKTCHKRPDSNGYWICDYCGSLWTEMLCGTGWLPLSCPDRPLPSSDRGSQ